MANLSQQKRQRMLEFLQTIREEHKDDDDVLIAIGEIESELNAKKYGLVWEQHEEAVDVQMRDNIPVFTECADKEIEQVLVYRKSDSATPYLQPQEYDYEKFVYSVNELAPGIEIQLGGKKVVVFQKGEWELVKHKEGFKEGLKEIWATGTILNGNSSGRFFRDYLDGRKEKDGLGVLYKVYGVGDDSFDYRYFSGPQKVTATKGKYYQGVPVDKMEEGSTKVSPIPNFYDMAGDFGNIRHEGGIPFNSGKKPIKLMSMFLNYFKQKDITVLDFFAGSASTAHAVLALNQADGGTRKFIICTNDENDICTEVTYPRISNVINGYANTKGIPANLKYYRTDFVPKDAEEVSEELLSHIAEMVQLENGVKLDGREYILVMSDDEADVLEQHWSEYTDVKALYVSKNVLFTTKQNALFKNVEIHTIPDYYFKFEMQEVGEAW